MILKELLERSEYTLVQGSEDVEISTLVYDSRKIEKGSVFVCISGADFDGHKFVAQAAELGAAAVVVEKDVEVPENLTVIKFDNTRLALAEMSAAYFGYPAEELTTIGITGTKGPPTTIYMFLIGAPAFSKVGVLNLLFGTKWAPTAADPSYGILYIILTSIIGTAVSILIGVPIALLTAVFLTEVSNKKLSAVVQPAVELLAAIPSVIYGLLGLMILNPVLYKLEKHIFANSATHQFTEGSNILAAILVF